MFALTYSSISTNGEMKRKSEDIGIGQCVPEDRIIELLNLYGFKRGRESISLLSCEQSAKDCKSQLKGSLSDVADAHPSAYPTQGGFNRLAQSSKALSFYQCCSLSCLI